MLHGILVHSSILIFHLFHLLHVEKNNCGSCWLSSDLTHILHLWAVGMPNFSYMLINCFQDAGKATLLSSGLFFLSFNVSNLPNNNFPTSNTSSPFPERESNKLRKICPCKSVNIWILSNRIYNSMVLVRSVSPIVLKFHWIIFTSISLVHPFASTWPPCPLSCTCAVSDYPWPSLIFSMGSTNLWRNYFDSFIKLI